MSLTERISERLTRPLDGSHLQRQFAPQLTYGRHRGPATWNMRSAAVLVLLCELPDDWALPMIVRPASMAHHAGQTCFPGGACEAGETPEQAALREAEEETSLDVQEVKILGRLSPLHVFASNFKVTPVLGRLSGWPAMSANPDEVQKILRVSLRELRDLASSGEHWVRTAGMEFKTPHLAAEGQNIWGASCMILAELLELVAEVTAGNEPLAGDE